jgi:hypothetical protein
MNMSSPADLLVLIPTLINREPEDMLVLITVKDGQMQAALGMEHVEDMDGMAGYVAAIVTQMAELRPDSLIVVFYVGDDHPKYSLVSLLIMATLETATPMTVHPAIMVKDGRFQIMGTDHWHDIEEVKASELAAALVLHGIPLKPEGLVIPEPTAVTDEVTQAIDDRVANIPVYPTLMPDAWAMPYVTEERALYEALLERGFGATEDEAVRLIACFQDPLLRDRLMVDTISNTTDPIEFGETITGQSNNMPDPERVIAAANLINNLMQWTCDRHRLPMLVAQAWMSWMQGRTLDAEQYLDAAVGTDPGYRMAKAFRYYIKEVKRLPDGVAHWGGPE